MYTIKATCDHYGRFATYAAAAKVLGRIRDRFHDLTLKVVPLDSGVKVKPIHSDFMRG